MYAVAYSVVKNEYDAGDVIGEAILKAYSRLDTLKNPEAFKSWIIRIVHNEAIELIRKNKSVMELDAAEHIASNDTESKRTETMDLQAALKTLAQPYSTVITLYYYEGFTVADIAEVTGVTALSVRKQLSRGRKQLRRILKEDFLHE